MAAIAWEGNLGKFGLVQLNTFGSSADGTSFNVTWLDTPIQGNMMIVLIACSYQGTVNTPTGWTLDASFTPNSNAYIFRKTAGASESTTTTFTTTASMSFCACNMEFSGYTSTKDIIGNANNSSSSYNGWGTSTVGATNQPDLVLGMVAMQDSATGVNVPMGNVVWQASRIVRSPLLMLLLTQQLRPVNSV